MASTRSGARPTPGSGGPAKDEPIFLDPTNDATFQSLKRLLSAPSTSTQHLSLLSENTLYGSITYYLSKLELEHVSEFAGVISSSGCLWTPPPPSTIPPPVAANQQNQSKPTQESKVSWTTETKNPKQIGASKSSSDRAPSAGQQASKSLSAFLIARSTAITQAVASAITRRTDLIVKSRKGSTGWGSRSALTQFIGAIVNGINATEISGIPESYKSARGLPIPRFAVIGGLLNGLYILKDQRRRRRDMSILEEMAALRANPALGLNIRRHVSSVEDEWIVTLAEILEALQGPTQTEETGPDAADADDDTADEWEKEFRKRAAEVSSSASITSIASKNAQRAALQQVRDVPLYLVAQMAPFVPDRKIQALDAVQLTAATSDAILSLFEGQTGTSFLATLGQDLTTGSDGMIALEPSGKTVQALRAISSATLFPLLGPLSKLLSRALAKAVTSLTPEDLSSLLLGTTDGELARDVEFFPILVRMSRLAAQLEASWLSSPLAGLTDDRISEASKKDTTQMWTTFKTLLFSYTMVFDSMMDALVEMCPSPTLTIPAVRIGETAALVNPSLKERKWPPASTSNLPPSYLLIVQTILATFAHLYWITSTFGSDGFDVYRKVFYSTLDVIGRDGEACIQLLELIRPERIGTTETLQTNVAKRSSTTYFLNVAEQLISVLPDEVVEELILPICRPYLEDTRFQDTFESAHSVILAIYSAKKRCTLELAPFYVNLLISAFPKLLNDTQLEYAFTTIVSALSDQDDSIAWWAMDRIAEEIEAEQMASSSSKGHWVSCQQGGYGESTVSKQDVEEAKSGNQSNHPSNPDSTAVDSTPSNGRGTTSQDRLTSLQMCFISCIPCINLVLLRSTLNKVERYILQHKNIEDLDESVDGNGKANTNTTRKVELCEKTFEAIQGLNAATREEGLRWWLDHRVQFGV